MCVVVNGNRKHWRGGGTAEERQLHTLTGIQNRTRERERRESPIKFRTRSYISSPAQLLLPVCKQSISYFATRTSLIVACREIIYTAAAAARLGGPAGKIDASFVPITRSKMRLPFKSARRARGAPLP
jgi:hypothetical protein